MEEHLFILTFSVFFPFDMNFRRGCVNFQRKGYEQETRCWDTVTLVNSKRVSYDDKAEGDKGTFWQWKMKSDFWKHLKSDSYIMAFYETYFSGSFIILYCYSFCTEATELWEQRRTLISSILVPFFSNGIDGVPYCVSFDETSSLEISQPQQTNKRI